MIRHLIMALVKAVAYAGAFLIGVIVDVIWVISPNLSNKLADTVISYVKREKKRNE